MLQEPNEPKLLPDIPKEIRAARIGTCFNSINRKLLDNIIAIDPNRLENGSVQFIGGNGDLKLKANSSADSASEGSFFAVDAKIKAGFSLCSASMGFKASVASSSASSSQNLNCFCSYVFSGQSLRLLNRDPKILYKYMSEEFQMAYSVVINSKDPIDYLNNYQEFVNKFGNGCITELYLTSGSAFMINVKYSDKSSANRHKYGGSVGASTPWGNGGSVAANFAKEISVADGNAEMNLIGGQVPQNTPTKDWCNSVMSSVLQAGFAELAKKPGLISLPQYTEPTAPVIPDGKPSKKEKPSKKKEQDITDDLKNKIMEEDGFEGTWEEYQKAQKKAYDDLDSNKIVKQASKIQSQRKSTTSDLRDCQPKSDANDERYTHIISGDPWDLGGYVPFAYKITPWSELFPELNDLKLPLTFTSIYIAKIYIFYLTRLQFAQYLNFLYDIGGEVCGNNAIDIDASIFYKICNDFLKQVQNEINQKSCQKVNEQSYIKWVNDFDGRVNASTGFNSMDVYRTFFEKYEFFTGNPYGFIAVDTKKLEYFPGNPVSRPFSIPSMLRHAIRFYPVIHDDGTVLLAFYDGKWESVTLAFNNFVTEKDSQGYFYINTGWEESKFAYPLLYLVGFMDIPSGNEDFYVRGMPMFGELPFAEFKEFAKPK